MYNKIFTKILDSSVWLEESDTRIVWITLIASMDEEGFCQFASVRNLANRAAVPLERAVEAVKVLESPDVDSSDPDHEGRRIERVPGGWMVLNSKKHRDLVKRVNVQEQTRARVQRFRDKKRGVTLSNADVTQDNADETLRNENVTPSEAYTESESETKAKTTSPTSPRISQIEKKTKSKDPIPTLSRGKGANLSMLDVLKQIELLRPVTGKAIDLQGQIAELMRQHGYEVEWEVPVPDRGDGTKGKIDLRFRRDTECIVMEVDRKTIRPKSITKLMGQEATRVVVLREATKHRAIPNIFRVISLGWPSDSEINSELGTVGQTLETTESEAIDEATEDTRPDPADAAGRIAQVLAMVPGISLGFAKSDVGGTGDDLPNAYEGLPEEVDPPALTPETIQGVNQRDRWQQLKLWLKQDLYMAGGAPINIQEVRFGTISPGESDYDYCFRDSYLEEHEMTEEALVWIVGSENPPALTAGLKKYSTRIQGLLRQIIPSMRVQLRVKPAEYERRLG